MALMLHNTLSRKREEFVPADPDRVTMYVCGPTVYSHPHIGNARPAVVFDVLARLLRRLFPRLVYARNITDVDDKINAAAAEQGVDISIITDRFIDVYHGDMSALGVLPPDIEPRATETIPEMIAMIERLIEAGHAYAAEGHVLFDVPSWPDYGGLSKRDRDELIAGARVDVAPYKRDPADFVLWKPSTGIQPGWDSPWGWGRPGWHLECSAMIEKHLGEVIDIHGGGLDLIFPHHENEIAQSVCSHGGGQYVRYWMHNGFVNMEAEKMSKSKGNILLVKELLEQAPGEAVRFALLAGHYRQPLDWTAKGLEQAKRTLDGLYRALHGLTDVIAAADTRAPDSVIAALTDDLNTPKALAELSALAKAANKAASGDERAILKAQLLDAGALLGLLQSDPAEWLGLGGADDEESAEIDALVADRQAARASKDFTEADRIRDELSVRGVEIEDGPDGPIWRRK